MKESNWRYLVDALLFVCLIGMALIGILLGLVISEGPVSSGGSKYFLGLHRHQWGNIHAYLSIAFVILLVFHLILSWKWITAKTRQIFKTGAPAALISAVFLPFCLLFLFWAFTPKNADTYRSYGVGAGENERIHRVSPRDVLPPVEGSGEEENISAKGKSAVETRSPESPPDEAYHLASGSLIVTGQHTLQDIEEATGISARTLAEKLGLPPQTDLNETLGRLRRRYGFEMQDVRDLVAKLLKEKEL